MKYDIRPMTAAEVPFVMDSWLNTWRVSKYAGVVRNSTYYTETRSLIEDLLARGMKVAVADAGSTLLGFIAWETKDDRPVVHYAYTKAPYLNLPVFDRLVDHAAGGKVGFHTFFHHRLDRAGWSHAPEICRRKDL